MGPLVPDIITTELNLIVALFIGIGFGYVLEQAGFSSSRKLTGLFYGTDFTVLRVFFTAGVTAMSGVLLLTNFGLLDMEIVYINPTYLYPALIGGAIMGVGFVVGGYCPGTSFCGAAIGKIDAMVFVVGGLLGVLAFSEFFPVMDEFYQSGFFGFLTVDTFLGLSKGHFALLLIIIALAAFIVTTKIELKVNPSSPMPKMPVRYHKIAALGVLLLGLILAVMPDYKSRILQTAADKNYQQQHPVKLISADELAFRILDKDPTLQIIDVRDNSEYSKMSLPGAENITMDVMFGKEWQDVLALRGKKKVFFADSEVEAVQAATLANLLNYENVAVLRGGLDNFMQTILNVQLPAHSLTRDEQDIYRFRLAAAPRLTQLIQERNAPKPVKKRVKKIQGGCGI